MLESTAHLDKCHSEFHNDGGLKNMTTSKTKALTIPLPPPSNKKMEIKNKLLLVFEVLWLQILLLPAALIALYKNIFPPAGKSLKGQVVLVTGAGRGLGRGLALRLGQEGCKVAVADVNEENALQTVQDILKNSGTAQAYFTNVAKVDEVKKLHVAITRDLGPLDILVHNAGLVYGEPLEDSPVEAIEAVVAVNLTSHFYMVKEFLPSMKARNSGHIVAVASAAAFCPLGNASAYVATKFGVRGFMEAVRAELMLNPNNKVKTTTVFPYFINTSAQYVDHWDIRIPPMSIEEAVEGTITGVKREEVTVSIPWYMYHATHISRLFPQSIIDKGAEIFYTRVIPPRGNERETTPTSNIIKNLAGIHVN